MNQMNGNSKDCLNKNMSLSRTEKVAALSFGKVLTAVISLISAVVLSRLLTKESLATYRQTLLAYNVAIPLLSLGIAPAVYYFLPTEKKRIRGLIFDCLIMLFLAGMLYAIFIALGGNQLLAKRFSNPGIIDTLIYLIPLPLVMLPATILPSVMVIQNRIFSLNLYNILKGLLFGLSVIGTCLLWQNPEFLVISRVLAGVISGIAGIYLILNVLPKDDWRPQVKTMKTILKMSMPLMLATSFSSISVQLDKIIVSSMCNPEDFAVYSIGALEIPIIGMITGSIASVILPDLRKMLARDDKIQALSLFRKAAARSATFLIPLMIFLIVSAKPFILTLFSSKYEGSIIPFQLYLLIIPIRIAQYGSFQTALGLTKQIMYKQALGLSVNIVLSIILVSYFGYIGAIIGTIISLYAVNSVWNISVISHAIHCRWWQVLPFKTVLILIFASSLAAIPILFIQSFNISFLSLFALILNAILYISTLIIVVWIFKIDAIKSEALFLFLKLKKYF